MPLASAYDLQVFLMLAQHYPEAAAARTREGRRVSSGEYSIIPTINHLAANNGQQDLRIQDVLLGDCNQILIEHGEIR